MVTPRPRASDSLEQEDYSTIESDSVDVESGSDYSSSTYQQPSAVVTLLDRLRQAPKVDMNLKRKIVQNLPRDCKRDQASRCMSEPKNVTMSQRVKEYPCKAFTVSANKLFCNACLQAAIHVFVVHSLQWEFLQIFRNNSTKCKEFKNRIIATEKE